MHAQHILDRFAQVASAIRSSIDQVGDWGLSGNRPGQYTIDVAADRVAVEVLLDAGFGVLSEESGVTEPERDIMVVVDPIDGSTNASAGLPWFATSLCALDAAGPVAALVVNQATGTRWQAVRGQGATRDGHPIRPATTARLDDALVAISGLPVRHLGWNQFRCYGAAALDICSVADGTFDAFADLSVDAHGAWDYLGALLILHEAGGVIVDRHDRELVERRHEVRRTPVAAATPALLDELCDALNRDGGVACD